METVKKAMIVQTLYMLSGGLGFLFIPNLLIPLIGFEPTQEIWIRVLGALILGFCFVNLKMTQELNIPYVRASIYGRGIFCSILAIFVILGMAPWFLIGLAIGEIALALWALTGLKKII